MSDDEPVDPKKELEDRCKAPCTRPLKEYQACAKRIQGDESGHKHCTGQYFDYWRCVDKCLLGFMEVLRFGNLWDQKNKKYEIESHFLLQVEMIAIASCLNYCPFFNK